MQPDPAHVAEIANQNGQYRELQASVLRLRKAGRNDEAAEVRDIMRDYAIWLYQCQAGTLQSQGANCHV